MTPQADSATSDDAPVRVQLTRNQILALERLRVSADAKHALVRSLFDLSATAYVSQVHAMLDDPASLAVDPLEVGRLQRIREKRNGARREGRPTR